MSSFLHRLLGMSRASREYEVAALQLRLLVAMAAVDDRIDQLETDHIVDFVDRVAASDRDEDQLYELLEQLIAAPPTVEGVLGELTRHASRASLGHGLVRELADVAYSDDAIDHREEFLLDLVCGVFGLRPLPLPDPSDDIGYDVEDEDLHRLVHRLALAARPAA